MSELGRMRTWKRYFQGPFRVKNYISLINLILRVSQPYKLLLAYLWGKGEFPNEYRVRAFGTKSSLTVFNAHDAITLIEVFCREDYKIDTNQRIFVDVGAKIGIVSCYFLMSNPQAVVYAYEPCISNLPKLAKNLENFRDRVKISNVALDVENGIKLFREEDTGRYGGFAEISNRHKLTEYPVQCLSINEEISRILSIETSIDTLKLDVEGMETRLLHALDPKFQTRIKKIYYELNDGIGKVVTH